MEHVLEEANIAMIGALGRPRTVLDVGCGIGLNGAAAVMTGAKVVGIEKNPSTAAKARRLLGEVIEVDPLDADAVTRALEGRKFDVILFADLLEGASEPSAVVKRYLEHLEKEGRVMISLRNSAAWNVKLKVQTPELGYHRNGSHRLFSHAEATDIVERSGLEVLRVAHNPMMARAIRPLVVKGDWVLPPPADDSGTAYRDLPVYKAYRTLVRPWEDAIAGIAPELLSYQHVVVARKPVIPGPLSLTVGMLTMDEEESIERMMIEIKEAAPDAKIICVDSSMKDQTPVIAERMGARVIRQLPPRGHGPAMEVLMYEAAKQSDALIYLDCDFTYPPALIPKLRKILESGVDVVNASRTRTRPDAMPLPNYLANKSFALLAQATAGAKVSDLHSGMRAYRSSVTRAFAFDGEGDAIPIDTLLWPAKCGYRVVEVPMDYQERVGFSKLRKVAGTVWTFIRLAKTLKVGERGAGHYEVWSGLDG
ncbi:MAG: methyltransferase domain-containing protein [Polyangiaceae bacterium]